MKRPLLNKLHRYLAVFRCRLKEKLRLDRKGDQVRIVVIVPAGVFSMTNYMSPELMSAWLDGAICASEKYAS